MTEPNPFASDERSPGSSLSAASTVDAGVDSAAREDYEPQGGAADHYDDRYFTWHAPIGEFGGWANLTKFADFINPDDAVLDFGCGGGWLLKNLRCKMKAGVEINAAAAEAARKLGLTIYSSTREAPDEAFDAVISNNALEHTLRPLDELASLRRVLRPGGLAVFVAPCENISYAYRPGDVNHHLYSWSPMALGNLFTEAGYEVLRAEPYIHKWPPGYRMIARRLGRRGFDLACRVYGRIARQWFQVRVVARRP